MKLLKMYIFLLFVSFHCFSTDLEKIVLENKESSLILKSYPFKDFISVDEKSIKVYSNKKDQDANKPEFVLYKEEIELFKKSFSVLGDKELEDIYESKGSSKFSDDIVRKINSFYLAPFSYDSKAAKPLKGLRVALDPGHIAGDMELGFKEERYMWLQLLSGEEIQFNEAELALVTAKLIKSKLEEKGAIVFISRPLSGKSSFGITYEEWLKGTIKESVADEVRQKRITQEKADSLLKQGDTREVWDFFLKVADIRNRAKLINDFHPHFTLIIHYNFGGRMIPSYKKFLKGKDKKLLYPTDENYSVMFIPGGISEAEVESKRDRLEILRLLLTKDMTQSLSFASAVQKRVNKDLKIPSLPRNNTIDYARKHSNYAAEGVYSRNLKLTRLVHSPLCYAEPLLQNNIKEAMEFNKKTFEYDGHKTSPRVKLIADAYYNAIIDYVNKTYKKK